MAVWRLFLLHHTENMPSNRGTRFGGLQIIGTAIVAIGSVAYVCLRAYGFEGIWLFECICLRAYACLNNFGLRAYDCLKNIDEMR
jgi:hypothetical protein